MPSLAEKATRFVLSSLQKVDPVLAGNIGFRLFTLPPSRRTRTQKAADVLRSGAELLSEARVVKVLIPGSQVHASQLVPTGPATGGPVLIVHGYGSRSEFMAPLARAIAAAGREAIVLDLPGHGQSTGATVHLGKAVEAIDAAWRQFGPFETMIGHSFGGASVLAAAAGAFLHVPQRMPARLVTIAAPSEMQAVFHNVGKRLGLGAAAQASFDAHAFRISGRPLTAFGPDDLLHAIPVPLMVIHAPDDKEVPFAAAEALHRASQRGCLVEAAGTGHRRIVSDPAVMKTIAGWLAGPVCGADVVSLPYPSRIKGKRLAA